MKKLLLLLFSFLISFEVLSETYVCSQDLTKFGKPGEIDTLTFERDGNSLGAYFKSDLFGVLYEITYESKSNLILTRLNDYLPSFSIMFINKDTKEWGYSYLKMEKYRRVSPQPSNYGKCIVVD